jgi:hypothetical protein
MRAESRCLAGPDRHWVEGTIRRVLADGTCKFEPDERHLVFPFWYGVPPAEVSLDDAGLWKSVFPRLTAGKDLLTGDSFMRAWQTLGGEGTDEQLDEYWKNHAPAVAGLNEAQAYAFFRKMHLSAKWIDVTLAQQGRPRYATFYWNLTRMGGRDPAEIAREVTVADARAALGVSQQPVDKSRAAQIAAFEKQNAISLPEELKTILERKQIEERFMDSHPNNPSLTKIAEWELLTDADPKVNGRYALTLVEPHQGCQQWMAVFDRGDALAKIYIQWEPDDGARMWSLTAPSAAMFFWDMAQTGLAWWDDTQHDGGRPMVATDIGLAYGEGTPAKKKWFRW